ncbi:dynamin family protein [Brevibacillus daliensis]|uniref:dynamin family protein n=1 Tax=Brevibacillus daliensis TaxID=2892995 RepID=UPI001E2B3CD2|nr:dynamin family protein [Brevibacillus daliensis]
MNVEKQQMATSERVEASQQVKPLLINSATKLRQASHWIKELAGMKQLAETMEERADRLEENRFTVALFGAFSAGKSSFANALMGEMILPVSPNPTTAAINKIMPPTETYPHGTVRVVLKSRDVIEEDVRRSLAVFHIQEAQLENGINAVAEMNISEVPANAKPHYTFIKAVKKGWDEAAPHLGQELLVDEKEFKKFVAKEEKACFADYIELYFSCPLTDQGMVLVDTPGADSINARHTGVAFEYLKNADVILFVTYYNHAFAHADREFLLQMGRVKDTFELDKMFFIVNAADLAQSPDELQDVLTHVEKNLLSCGIRHPRIYPISSQTAILSKMLAKGSLAPSAEKVYRQRTDAMEGELPSAEKGLVISGMPPFERDFLQYTVDGLALQAVAAADGEIRRAHDRLREYIELAQEGESAREERREGVRQAKEQATLRTHSVTVSNEERNGKKEQEELLYYVKQRLFFRFSEFFASAFNPAALKDDGRNLKKAAQDCLEDLFRSIGYDLAQEMRATFLRLEKYMNKSGDKLVLVWQKELQAIWSGIELAPYKVRSLQTPNFAEELPAEPSVMYSALSLFKNPKDFFEGEGRSNLRAELEKRMHEQVDRYLEQAGEILATALQDAFNSMSQSERQKVMDQVEEYSQGLFAALDAKVDVNQLKETETRLATLV